jgi:hypothetical protein
LLNIQLKLLFFLSSYGSPLGDPLFASNSDINPRLPGSINKRFNGENRDEENEDDDEDTSADNEDLIAALDDIQGPGYK